MNDRIPLEPPVIAPVSNLTEERPLWSVMIPAYNCINYLKYTIQSVLAQDPGEEHMQIEVVDDFSTDGDVAALVKEVGKGRIKYFRQERNRGSLRNFETCLNRSRGHLVHLLHGDDQVKPGFYKEIEGLYNQNPEIGAAFTDFAIINEEGVEEDAYEASLPAKHGVIDNFVSIIAQCCYLQTPAIVVRRSVYEKLGGFFAVHYGEDWEMWIRIAAHYPVAYSPQRLALYRSGHSSSITQRSLISGQNVKDIAKVIDIVQDYLPVEKKKQLKRLAKKNFSIMYAGQSYKMYRFQRRTAFIQAREALKLNINLRSLYWVIRLYISHFFHLLHIDRYKQV
ncbi:MAG: glycosyltransferase [Williamsia sp.]|nr:glycosyltransferase [Williamsia sp.]